jgi:two-component system chemotaxis response regulator CheB
MAPIRVLIVDDSAFIRKVFSEFLSQDPDIQVVDTAEDPLEAREKIKQHNPDVLTLDIEMPKMDGLSFLEKIMSLRPMPVVMASTLTQRGADVTLKALEMGAVDYIPKPTSLQDESQWQGVKDELIQKVKAAALAKVRPRTNKALPTKNEARKLVLENTTALQKKVIAIGASTGGVEALRDVLSALPQMMPPIVVVQHMPEKFTGSFANRLDSLCALTVREATDNAPLAPGIIYIAPGNAHLRIKGQNGKYICHLSPEEDRISGHKPSVDALFSSVAECVGSNSVGMILTGMGKDGAQGLLEMRQKGAITFGQNEETCVVYGMPKSAMQLGAVAHEHGLHQLAEKLVQSLKD